MSDFPWRCGANFLPSTAANQLEMWQADTFDPATIDRELGWARKIGMRLMRVFLHDLAWLADPEGLKARFARYLEIAAAHGIATMPVFFDDCSKTPFLAAGKQPEPRPFVHNSCWIQSPGDQAHADPAAWGRLRDYVADVIGAFGRDPRVVLWDLYNEPGNLKGDAARDDNSLDLVEAVFAWARAAAPTQPLTCGPWDFSPRFDALNRYLIANSDVVSFHCYERPDVLRERINHLRRAAAGRPLVCSEYMARTNGSTFAECLPILKENDVSAVNWGLVSGRTNTIYPWGWGPEKGRPERWFHDVFNPDGTLLYPEEAAVFAACAPADA